MRHISNWLLMAALAVGLGMSSTACTDDDDDNDGRTAEERALDPYDKEGETATALYRLVSQLSVCDSLPDNWKSATFEPRLGTVTDASQPRVRTITVSSAAEAVTRYNSLTGKNLPATTTSDTYEVDGMGKLTLTVGGAGTIATIDVDVKQMPQLQLLRMVSVSDMGENGHFSGEPYYSFGDVVRDKDDCHWICVRPAYSPSGKEDTHWMSFQLNENSNIKYYRKSNTLFQAYPVNLGVQKEKMQYLAQLLAILADPDEYETWAGMKGIPLGGLGEEAMSPQELTNLAWLWNIHDIWNKIAPELEDQVDEETFDFSESFTAPVCFIYEKGSVSGTKLSIPCVEYNGLFYTGIPTYTTKTIDMTKNRFNCKRYFLNYSTQISQPDTFIVRYKTGFQLSSNIIFSPKATEAIPGVRTVFRYKEHKNELDDTGISKSNVRVGNVIAKNGRFYKNADEAKKGGGAIAVVVYAGEKGSVETGTDYRGLAISINNIGKNSLAKFNFIENKTMYDVCTTQIGENEKDRFRACLNGLQQTQILAQGCGKGHVHPAAYACINDERLISPLMRQENGFSDWFLPSTGQWILMAENLLGMRWNGNQFNKPDSEDLLDFFFDNAGIYVHFDTYQNLFTSTHRDSEHCWSMSFYSDEVGFSSYQDKIFYQTVVPMMAF